MKRYIIPTLLVVLLLENAFIGVLFSDGYARLQVMEEKIIQIDNEFMRLSVNAIEQNKKITDVKSLANNVSDRQVRGMVNIQKQISNESQKTVALVKDAEKKIGISKADLSVIVNEWSSRVVRILCSFSSQIASGSGTAGIYGDKMIVFTNRHVLSDNGYGPQACVVQFTNGQLRKVQWQETSVRKDVDWGGITLSANGNSLGEIKVCDVRPSIGDQVIVLGYPGIGAQDSITVTEGIISGYEGSYFVTSAKVEHGNSGGAAILVKDDCYLGPPSFGETGSVESLSRILDVHATF